MAQGIDHCIAALDNTEGAIIAILGLTKPGSIIEKTMASFVLAAKLSYLALELAKSLPEIKDLDAEETSRLTLRCYQLVQNVVNAVNSKSASFAHAVLAKAGYLPKAA